ncbi:MAG: stage II sporulation protein M [Desulfosarcina sp.]
MKAKINLLYPAWKQLIVAYLLAFTISLVVGTMLVKIAHVPPQRLYEMSTKRIAYVLPVFDMGARHGIDMGILLFVWNTTGALITLSFLYTAAWFDPDHIGSPPRALRKIFGGDRRMKIFCHFPGCAKIEAEPLRRLYVWLMVPLFSIIILGIESGLQVSTSTVIFGSFFSAIFALLPHGLVEIPTLTFAGAVSFSAHLLVKKQAPHNLIKPVFDQVENHRSRLPIMTIALLTISGLFLAGWIEAHVTPLLL